MDGGPAFPVAYGAGRIEGMTLRDYFAAKAMQGWVASYPTDMDTGQALLGAHAIAAFSYAVADAMLKARTA